jgi:cysteine synthase B
MAQQALWMDQRVEPDLLSHIGNTPLVRLTRTTAHLPQAVQVFAKAEWFNPGGSVKDRAALSIIEAAERAGELTRNTIILDATSGNTGIAYAMIAAAKGYRVRLCMASNVSLERKNILRAYGADMVFTDPAESSDGAIRKARQLYAENPAGYFYADQYNNDANWQAHYLTTGPEIYEQTNGRVTHFVAGLGTGGTFVGTGRRLHEYDERIQLISVEPDSGFHGLEGLKHMPTAIVPGIYDPGLADSSMRVGTEESYAMVRRLAREEGLLVGISSGAAAACALRVAAGLKEGVVVTVFPDSGDRYLTHRFWSEGE